MAHACSVAVHVCAIWVALLIWSIGYYYIDLYKCSDLYHAA
jgi:hypothetical protein